MTWMKITDDQGVVTDAFALLEEGFPPTEPVSDIGLVFATKRRQGRDGAGTGRGQGSSQSG